MSLLPTALWVRNNLRTRLEKRVEAFEKGYRQNIGLAGPAGMGKTYILNHFFERLSRQGRLLPVYIHAAALDFDHFVENWIGGMLTGLFLSLDMKPPAAFQSLMATAEPIIPRTHEKIRHLKKQMHREKSSAIVKELFALTAYLSEEVHKKVVLMVDEFQELENLPASDPFALFGKEIMVQTNTLYFVTSSQPSRAKEIFKDHLSLLFGNFEIMDMDPFSFDEASRFLETRLPGYYFTENQKRFLIRMTDGRPSHLEILLDRLESYSAAYNPDVFEGFPDELIIRLFQDELFNEKGRIALGFKKQIQVCSQIAKDAAPYIRVLFAIADGRRKASAIATSIEKATTETNKILQRLTQEGLVTRKGSFFIIEDPLFRFWLREIYPKRLHTYSPDFTEALAAVGEVLKREWDACQTEEKKDLPARIESLFKEFHNDVIEMDQKKVSCPQFSEISFRPTNGRVFPLYAKSPKTRWACQIAPQPVHEEDVFLFLEEMKKQRKKIQQKLLITLAGIDQNAKLIAQQARVQIWDLKNLNTLLDLYNQPKMIVLPEEQREFHEQTMGAVAQNVHTA